MNVLQLQGMGFRGEIVQLPPPVVARMRGVSWHAQLPGGFIGPALEDLRLLRVVHWDFTGTTVVGELIVAATVAENVVAVFANLHAAQFPIAKLRLVDEYAGDDQRSMDDNNSSGFNSRLIAGTAIPSQHALGLAIDINPVQNPYTAGGHVLPAAGEAYLDRTQSLPGMIHEGGPAVQAFEQIGWQWGGRWQGREDYHHFEAPRPR